QTLAALKRAYADTILNTTKEAAARVLSSEKKTRMYQQEIVTVKDEAITTLLRLKQMYDSKVKETEEMSLKQQQKVEELEAQLGEAEDIVGELRMELRALHDELNKVTNGNTSYLKGDQEVSCPKASDAAVSSSHERSGAVPVEQSGSVVANGITNQSLARISSIKRCSSKDSMDRCHHTLPSILTKRREVEGCTQMIHAVDKKSMANGDGKDPMVSQNTSPKEHEHNRRTVISATEARKEEKEILASSMCEETPVLAAASKNRCIKYTFKRKRKKEASSNLEGDSSFEESRNVKQKTAEKDDGYLESLKPSFTGESSRDSFCVAQVARQANWFWKLKQWKIDARRRQWIYQWKRASVGEAGMRSLRDKLTDRKTVNDRVSYLESWSIDDHHDGLRCYDDSDDDETDLSASSPTSVLKNKDSDSNKSVHGCFCCSNQITEEEEEDAFDDAYDNWEDFSDALNSFESDEDSQRKKKSSPRKGKCKQEASPEKAIHHKKKNKKKKKSDQKKEGDGGDEEISECPICSEEMDVTDLSFLPCPCGFRLCLFCHKQINENDGRCPACRNKYEQTSSHNSREVSFQQRGRGTVRLSPSFKGLDIA
ncbi:unnamed protein product, partial [Brassica oleracea]